MVQPFKHPLSWPIIIKHDPHRETGFVCVWRGNSDHMFYRILFFSETCGTHCALFYLYDGAQHHCTFVQVSFWNLRCYRNFEMEVAG